MNDKQRHLYIEGNLNTWHPRESRHAVAQAWANSQPAKGSNIKTDGSRVWSYNHVVAVTESDGTKVAFGCHYSTTTAKHCAAVKVKADRVLIHCPSCIANRSPQGTLAQVCAASGVTL